MRRARWIGSLLLLLLVLGGLYGFYAMSRYASRGGEQAPLYSTRRYDPYGTAALYELLRSLKIPVTKVDGPRLPTDRFSPAPIASPDAPVRDADDQTPMTLIQVLPNPQTNFGLTSGASKIPVHRLEKFIEAGHTVVQLTSQRTKLMDVVGVPDTQESLRLWQQIEVHMQTGMAPDDLPGLATIARWAGAGGSDDSARSLHVVSPMTFAESEAEGWEVVARTANGKPIAGMKTRGKNGGKLIVIGGTTALLNHQLGEHDHLDILFDLIGYEVNAASGAGERSVGNGVVLLDEWSHGVGHKGTIISLITQIGLLPVLLQLAVVVGFYFWSTRPPPLFPRDAQGRRKGIREEIDPVEISRSRAEQIAVLGRLYNVSLTPEAIETRTGELVRNRLAHALGKSRMGGDLNHALDKLAKYNEQTGRDVTLAERGRSILTRASTLRRVAPIPCTRCGYNLRHSVSPTCPECGIMLTSTLVRKINAAKIADEHAPHLPSTTDNANGHAPDADTKITSKSPSAESDAIRLIRDTSRFIEALKTK